MSDIKALIKKNKKTIIILIVIVLTGIFLRTYKFHDWLRFSKDQSRDARIISNTLRGAHLPYLGPNAGVTKFRLGPVYYYFSYVSEKIFGSYPDKMAYPSVFFSILSIPFLFFLLREFFSKKISLSMTAIASVSYFLVINSRFSSNPNLITFFVLLYLYSLLKILNKQEKRFYIWSALAGIGMGVGIQLHTTLLITMPIITLGVFAYIFIKNKSIKLAPVWKSLFVIILFSLVLNTSQIYSEIDSHGSNTKLFFKGFEKSSNKESNLAKNTFLIASCQIQANTHIISSFQEDINCKSVFRTPEGNITNKFIYYLGITVTILFSLTGYFFLSKRFWKEKDEKRKNFLSLVIFFNLISFIILIPIANIIFIGYFINLFFIPFVLLGILLEEIQWKFGKIGTSIAVLGVVFLVVSSLARDGLAADRYMKGLENNSKNSTLGEVELMRDYVFSTSGDSKQIYFSGQNSALASRFYAPVSYFCKESGIKIDVISLGSFRDNQKTDKNAPIYYIEENSIGKNEPEQTRDGYEIISRKKFSSQTILILKQ